MKKIMKRLLTPFAIFAMALGLGVTLHNKEVVGTRAAVFTATIKKAVLTTGGQTGIPDGPLTVGTGVTDISIVNDGAATITVSFAKNSSTTTSIYNNSAGEIRLYPGSTNGGQLTYSIESGYKITAIQVKASQNSGATIGSVAWASGDLDETVAFSVETSSVVVKNTTNATSGSSNQLRLSEAIVTYESLTPVSYDPVTSVVIDQSPSVNLFEGNSQQLSATVSPSTADPKVTWTSNNEDIATVSPTGVVTAVGVGSTTVVSTTVGLTSGGLSATNSITVNVNEFTMADLRDSSGATIPGYVGKTFTVKGTVTKIQDPGYNRALFLQSGVHAVQVYGLSAIPAGVVIGSLVEATGTYSLYNGLLQLGSPTATLLSDPGEVVTPLNIIETDWNSTYLLGKDSRLITTSLTPTASTADLTNNTSSVTVTMNLGATSVDVRVNGFAKPGMYADFNTLKARALLNSTNILYKGVLGVYNTTYQLSPLDNTDFYTTDTVVLDDFVANRLAMSSNTIDQCLTLFGPAKNDMLALTEEQVYLFQNLTRYSAAKARYEAWAAASADLSPYAVGGGTGAIQTPNRSNENVIASVLVIGVIGLSFILGFAYLEKKRKNN